MAECASHPHHLHLHPPIQLPPFIRIIPRHRPRLPIPLIQRPRPRNPVFVEISHHALGALAREVHVVGLFADGVGVAVDLDDHAGVGFHDLDHLVELNVGAGVELPFVEIE